MTKGAEMNAEWIDALDGEKWPPRLKRLLGFISQTQTLVVCYQDHGEWYSNDHNNQYSITHWMPLPEPPRRESSFEKWWGQAKGFNVIQQKLRLEPREAAYSIWKAALAASKKPDFVE